jgi:hypothetical protein
MEYIINKKQYNLISEALGVPDSILDAADELYDMFLKHFESITQKSNKYTFNGNIDVVLGDKKKIHLDGYSLVIEINKHDEYDGPPQLISMGMNQSFTFDTTLLMKKIDKSSIAEFSIVFLVGDEWEPSQLYDEYSKDKDLQVGVVAHELKHKYDKQVKRIDLIGHDAEYSAAQTTPRFDIGVIDNKFIFYLYYTHLAEDLVRTTEVASQIKSKKISQSEFIEFLRENNTFKTLVEIKNFSLEKFVEGISKEMPKVDEILQNFGKDPSRMTDSQKIKDIFELIQINLSNTKIETFNDYVLGPMGGLFNMFQMFGGKVPDHNKNVEKVKEKFYYYVTKLRGRPIDFIESEIKRFNDVADKTIKKLSKLYAMTHKNQTNESIINWGLHSKLMEKKYGKKVITLTESKLINLVKKIVNEESPSNNLYNFLDKMIIDRYGSPLEVNTVKGFNYLIPKDGDISDAPYLYEDIPGNINKEPSLNVRDYPFFTKIRSLFGLTTEETRKFMKEYFEEKLDTKFDMLIYHGGYFQSDEDESDSDPWSDNLFGN